MSNILPPNATELELSLDKLASKSTNLEVKAKTLWSPYDCPADILPWLAWALSVDDWDTDWDEATKRRVIANSIPHHKTKGTVGALKRALQSLGYEVEINENTGEVYTFRVNLDVSEQGISNDTYGKVEGVALRNKNVRSHLAGVDALLRDTAFVYLGSASLSGEDTKLFPNVVGELSNESAVLFFGATEYCSDTTKVLPYILTVAVGTSADTFVGGSCSVETSYSVVSNTVSKIHIRSIGPTDDDLRIRISAPDSLETVTVSDTQLNITWYYGTEQTYFPGVGGTRNTNSIDEGFRELILKPSEHPELFVEGAVVYVDVFDGWGAYRSAPWEAEVEFLDGYKKVFTGGITEAKTVDISVTPKRSDLPPQYEYYENNGQFTITR